MLTNQRPVSGLLANQRPVLPVRSNCECCYKCKMIRKRSQLISTDMGWLFIMNWMNLRGREARGIAIQRVVWRHHLNLELINWRLASDWLLAASMICNFELCTAEIMRRECRHCIFHYIALSGFSPWNVHFETKSENDGKYLSVEPIRGQCVDQSEASRYLTVEVCLCTRQLSYKEQVKPHSSCE